VVGRLQLEYSLVEASERPPRIGIRAGGLEQLADPSARCSKSASISCAPEFEPSFAG
jgi:hypothetical protein